MGRFYDGDIQGKFWFGVQGSYDIECLVNVTPVTYYSWHVCNCVAEIDWQNYCNQCYDSKEAHIDSAIEEEEYEDESLYYEDCTIGYSLDKETHYEELLKSMADLKKKIPEEIIAEFEKIEQNNDILDAFTGVFNHTHQILNKRDDLPENLSELVARYTLGYQIEYCLRTTDSCNVSCEE